MKKIILVIAIGFMACTSVFAFGKKDPTPTPTPTPAPSKTFTVTPSTSQGSYFYVGGVTNETYTTRTSETVSYSQSYTTTVTATAGYSIAGIEAQVGMTNGATTTVSKSVTIVAEPRHKYGVYFAPVYTTKTVYCDGKSVGSGTQCTGFSSRTTDNGTF